MRRELVLAILVTTLTLAGSGCAAGPRQPTFAPSPAQVQQPTDAPRPAPTNTSEPSSPEEATDTPSPTPSQTLRPTDTPRPTSTAKPTLTPALTPSGTPAPTGTPAPSEIAFLTVPFYPDAEFQRPGSPFGQDALPDLYNDRATAIAYDGRTNPCNSGQFPCAHDGHGGIDFGVAGHTPVRAAYSGTVYQRFTVNVPGGDPPDVHKLIVGTGIDVWMPVVYRTGEVKWETRELCIQYVHLFPSVNLGDVISRGDEIGSIDPRGGGPHLHMEINGCKNGSYAPDYQRAPVIAIDPYLTSEEVLQTLLPLGKIPPSYLRTADVIVIPSNFVSTNGLWLSGEPRFPD